MATLGGKLTSRWTWLFSPWNSTSSASKSRHTSCMISSIRDRCRSANTLCRNFVTKTKWTCIAKTQCLPVRMPSSSAINQHGTLVIVQLRYTFRVCPTSGQQIELAKAFGCARVVFNDGLRLRWQAREQALPYVSDGELSRRIITEAKLTPDRAWLGEVSSVV